jgi:hypothetical protein
MDIATYVTMWCTDCTPRVDAGTVSPHPPITRSTTVHVRHLLFSTALFLAACSPGAGGGGADGVDQTVLPIEDVIDGDITITPDVSGDAAVLMVRTDVNMACAIVFGEDENLGRIATDDDMAGGAHQDHQVRMTGLEPDTEYTYRLQGSGEDGKLYRGELMTFRTAAASEVVTPGDDIAPQGEVVDVSSEFGDAFRAANAIDGDVTTEWSSDGDGDDASLAIDLGEEVDVVGVGFRTREMSDGTAIVRSYTVTVDDGETFGPFEVGSGLSVAEVGFTGRVLRFDTVETTGGNTGAVAIEVYR